ncbi:putative ubiquitin hydrolase [Trypanosoma theileri]|uniref:Putative ubiquitin hydrolase n=1 Tax=Trypanosoma theileri TaxID=67003 RepID=A0A1X0NVG0_9TRYP|nr:putative ubiquitin hydrolase [Trypanosoma theileri]ORC88189.1 putative ubiquitin hydrolase [Trypanosoma theileri]
MNASDDDKTEAHSVRNDESGSCVGSSAEDSAGAAAALSSSRSNCMEGDYENEEDFESSGLRKETDTPGYGKEIISSEHGSPESKEGGGRLHTTVSSDPHAENAQPPPSVGLVNEGCTCYLNSLLQLLFHLSYFRNAVYRMPVEEGEGDKESIPQALQELFFQMQERDTPAHTKKLTSAFGWGERELFVQHDIQEMATLLRDNLEERMKGTVAEGTINQLFQGSGKQIVATLDRTFVSPSHDTFYDIHLPLGSNNTLIDSLRSLTAKELLIGDNKYRVEEPGKEPEYKDAEKSYRFCRFPPVIWFHLKRFEMNLMSPSLEMKKVNNRLEFPVELSLEEFEKGDSSCSGSTSSDNDDDDGNDSSDSSDSDSDSDSSNVNSTEGGDVDSKDNEEEEDEEKGEVERAEEDTQQEQREKQKGKKQSKRKYETRDEEGEEEEEEQQQQQRKEKKKKNKKNEKKKNKNTKGVEQPFSKDSPPIYDLQGVIVHRGSVRSGHYYCYIREWDPVQARFTRWIEFDDERVRVVDEETAVSNNFGGPVIRHGRPCNPLSTNNAYILSYVRRADCPKVLAPSPTDIIPQRVKDVFRRDMLEDDRREQEERERRRKLTIFIITDEIIRECVNIYQRETMPRDARVSLLESIAIEVQKSDTVRHVYATIASHGKLHTLSMNPLNFRLWRLLSNRNIHYLRALNISIAGTERVMQDYLDNAGEEHSTMTSLYIYLQQPTTLQLVPSSDIRQIPREREFVDTVSDFPYAVFLPTPIQLEAVTIYFECYAHSSVMMVISISLYDVDGNRINYEDQGPLSESKTFRVNSESRSIRGVECSVKVPHRAARVVITHVQIGVSNSTLSSQRTRPRLGESVLPIAALGRVLVFFKYFNYNTCRLVYAGSAVVSLAATVKECGRALLQLLGEGDMSSASLDMYKEESINTRLLQANVSLMTVGIESGSILIAQRNDVPLISRFRTVNSYINGFSRIFPVYFIHIDFSETETTSGMDKRDTNLNNAMLPVSSSSPLSSGGGGKGVSDGISTGRFSNRSDSNMLRDSSCVVEVVHSSTNVENESFHTYFYPERCFRTVMTYREKRDVHWRYEEICDYIGNASGFDPNFIRLYRNSVDSIERAVPEPDPAPSVSSFADPIRDPRNKVLFFEVLREPRRIVDSRLCVIITVRSEKDEPLYTERIIVRENAMYGELVQGTLERCTEALRRAAAVKRKKNISESSGKNNNDNNDKDKNATNTSSQPSEFTVGEHYLLLVMDICAGVIKEIIEIPRGADGRWECHRVVGSLSGRYSGSHIPHTTPLSESNSHANSVGAARGRHLLSASSLSHPSSLSLSSSHAHLYSVGAGGGPLSLVLVPAAPLGDAEWRLACGHAEWHAGTHGGAPLLFAQPFAVTLHVHDSVARAREVLLQHTGVPPAEVEAGGCGVIMYTDTIWHFSNWNEQLLPYWKNTECNTGRIPTLLLNHRRPKEKPGSRYVAQNNPALSISKR